MNSPLYYIRVWLKLVQLSIKRSRLYKTEMASRLIRAGVIILLQVILAQSLFSLTDDIAGWSRPQYYLLLATYNIVMYTAWGIFSTNLYRLNEKVGKGEVDYLLTKPTGNYFESAFGEFFIDDMLPALGGVVLLAIYLATQPITVVGGILYVALLVLGLITWLSITTIFASISFYTIKLRAMDLVPSLGYFGNVPGSAWGKWEIVLQTVFPVGLVAVLPAQTFWQGPNWQLIFMAVVVVTFFYVLSRLIWNISVRRYEGGS